MKNEDRLQAALDAAVDADELICGLIAETNADGFAVDTYRETSTGMIEFRLLGDQNPEKPWCGHSIKGHGKWDGETLEVIGGFIER